MPSFLGHPRGVLLGLPSPSYGTWNRGGTDANITLSNADLTGEVTGPTAGTAYGMSATTGYDFEEGKRYFEISIDNISGSASGIAVGLSDTNQVIAGELGDMAYAYAWRLDGHKETSGILTPLGNSASSGDLIQIAIHAHVLSGIAKARIWFGKNGQWLGGGNPALGTNPAFDDVEAPIATDWGIRVTMKATGDRLTGNFGANPFIYGVPSGFEPGWGENIR